MAAWPVLALDHLVMSGSEASKWAWIRKNQKNPNDYVSIRYGFQHVAYAHTRHQGPCVALYSELSGIPQEELSTQSIKTVQQSTGVPIKVESRELICICCEEPKEKKDESK